MIDSPATVPAVAPGTMSKDFDIDCSLNYQVSGVSDFLFQIHALDAGGQAVLSESLTVTPAVPMRVFTDPAQGRRLMRLQVPSGALELRYRASVRCGAHQVDSNAAELAIADLPDQVLHHLMPSRYCESDVLSHAAQKQFGDMPRGYSRVMAICDWIHANIDYRTGATTATTTARDVFTQRAGVCRDFAHLAVTFCRALNIPARVVVGYARFADPPPDFHAVFEAYLAGGWTLFDATRMSPLDELVRIASGHDAKDVAFATIYGPAVMTSMCPTLSRSR